MSVVHFGKKRATAAQRSNHRREDRRDTATIELRLIQSSFYVQLSQPRFSQTEFVPAISAARAHSRRRAIIDAAAKLFVQKGYASTSISEIAAVAGVSDGLIYRYVDDKKALLDIVLAEYFEKIVAKLEQAAASDVGFEEKVHRLISQHLRSFLEDLDFCRFFVSDVRSANGYRGSPVQKLNRTYTRIFVRVLEDAIASGEIKANLDPKLVRDMVFGAVEHVAWRYALQAKAFKIDIDEVARQLTEVTLSGVLVRAKSPPRRTRS